MITADEAAKLLGISRGAVYDLAENFEDEKMECEG